MPMNGGMNGNNGMGNPFMQTPMGMGSMNCGNDGSMDGMEGFNGMPMNNMSRFKCL